MAPQGEIELAAQYISTAILPLRNCDTELCGGMALSYPHVHYEWPRYKRSHCEGDGYTRYARGVCVAVGDGLEGSAVLLESLFLIRDGMFTQCRCETVIFIIDLLQNRVHKTLAFFIWVVYIG